MTSWLNSHHDAFNQGLEAAAKVCESAIGEGGDPMLNEQARKLAEEIRAKKVKWE